MCLSVVAAFVAQLVPHNIPLGPGLFQPDFQLLNDVLLGVILLL